MKYKTQTLPSKEFLIRCLMIIIEESTRCKNKTSLVSSFSISIFPLQTSKKSLFLILSKRIMPTTKMDNHPENEDQPKDLISKISLLFINKFIISSIKIINSSQKYPILICIETMSLCQSLVEKESHNNFNKAQSFIES